MRLRSESADTAVLRSNSPSGQSGRCAVGKRFKLPKLWGGQRSQPVVNNTPATNERCSPKEEEPQKKNPTFRELIEAQHFSEASRLLTEREERLFGDITEADALRNYEEEVGKLAVDYSELKGLVMQTVERSLSPGELSIEALTSAVKAINQEVDQDEQWEKRSPKQPTWRPSDWKKLHNEMLRSLVEERMDNPSTPPAEQMDQSSIQADIHSMGRQLKEDLQQVVRAVRRCYPPQFDICNVYARLYHQNLSARLRKIADFVLGDKDCMFLLRWVNEYYPQILQKPELASEIDVEALGKLLPQELLKPLEEQYLSKQQEELSTYISRILEEARENWNNGEEPTREDGCFVSPVAYDIIQLINGMVTSAEKVVLDRQKAQDITCQLTDLMQRFRTFHNDIMKQNKPNSRPFIKANLGSIEQFSDVLHKRSYLFPADVRETCLGILPDMKRSAHAYLLKPVHETLKPHYRKLGTSDWLNKYLFEKLLVSIELEIQDLQGSTASCHQELIGQLHQEVTVEYVKRLLRGEVKLKDKERQRKAYLTIQSDAENLHDLFVDKGSKEAWLKDILTRIAEVLKLQELPAIQMHIASLGSAFPDLSEKHISALLKLKTNFSKADRKTVKETLRETLKETSSVSTRPFFSAVQVR